MKHVQPPYRPPTLTYQLVRQLGELGKKCIKTLVRILYQAPPAEKLLAIVFTEIALVVGMQQLAVTWPYAIAVAQAIGVWLFLIAGVGLIVHGSSGVRMK